MPRTVRDCWKGSAEGFYKIFAEMGIALCMILDFSAVGSA
jgi:hypothetical protein